MNKEVLLPNIAIEKREQYKVKLFKEKIEELLGGHSHAEYRVNTPEENHTLILFSENNQPGARLRSNKPTIDEKNHLNTYPYVDIRFGEENDIMISEGASIIAENGVFLNWPERGTGKALSREEKEAFRTIALEIENEGKSNEQKKADAEFTEVITKIRKEKVNELLNIVLPVTRENKIDSYGRNRKEKERDDEVNSFLIEKANDLLLDAELTALEYGDNAGGIYNFETDEGKIARIEKKIEGYIIIDIGMEPCYENGENIMPVKHFSLSEYEKTLLVSEKKLTAGKETVEPRKPRFDSRATLEDQAFLAGTLRVLKPVPRL